MNKTSILIATIAALPLIGSGMLLATPIGLSQKSLSYIGAFRVPHGKYNGTNFASNPFVNAQYQPFAYNPVNNSLFMGQVSGLATAPKRVGEFTIPEIIDPATISYDIEKLSQSSVIQVPQDLSEGNFDRIRLNGNIPGDEAKAQLGGLYVYNGKLLGTVWGYYDANGALSYRSHFSANLDWTNQYGFNGLHAVGVSPTGSYANGGFVGGYMTKVPSYYRAQIGFPMLTGRTGGPIVSRSSYGPTLWGFDPSSFNFDTPAPAKMFIGYPDAHQTLGGYSDTPSVMFNRSSGVKGVIWPEGTNSIMFFGSIGLGIKFDDEGVPVINNAPACEGPGTSSRSEAKTNFELLNMKVNSWTCGYQVLDSNNISNGDSCCFDPINPDYAAHHNKFVIGDGGSCYGPGTKTVEEARTNGWLKEHSPSSYTCGGLTMSGEDIAQGSGCCFVGTLSTDKGGTAYPSIYRVWQYDANDIIEVKNGTKKAWELIPKIWTFDLPFVNPERSRGLLGVAFDEDRKLVYIAQPFSDGNYPLIHVFKLDLTPAPSKTPLEIE